MNPAPDHHPHEAPANPADESRLVEAVLAMYREGWFPMGEDNKPAEWVQPRRRSVLPLATGGIGTVGNARKVGTVGAVGGLHIPRTLAQRVRSGRFDIRSDTAFDQVLRACAGPRTIEGEPERSTWISPDIIAVFEALYRAGHAHSVEAWWTPPGHTTATLVGGLYGLCLGRGGVFCGESMFSRPDAGGTDASKVCLVHLVGHLRRQGFAIIDAQIANTHTARFGFVERSASWYHARIKHPDQAARVGWGVWDARAAFACVPEIAAL